MEGSAQLLPESGVQLIRRNTPVSKQCSRRTAGSSANQIHKHLNGLRNALAPEEPHVNRVPMRPMSALRRNAMYIYGNRVNLPRLFDSDQGIYVFKSLNQLQLDFVLEGAAKNLRRMWTSGGFVRSDTITIDRAEAANTTVTGIIPVSPIV